MNDNIMMISTAQVRSDESAAPAPSSADTGTQQMIVPGTVTYMSVTHHMHTCFTRHTSHITHSHVHTSHITSTDSRITRYCLSLHESHITHITHTHITHTHTTNHTYTHTHIRTSIHHTSAHHSFHKLHITDSHVHTYTHTHIKYITHT